MGIEDGVGRVGCRVAGGRMFCFFCGFVICFVGILKIGECGFLIFSGYFLIGFRLCKKVLWEFERSFFERLRCYLIWDKRSSCFLRNVK